MHQGFNGGNEFDIESPYAAIIIQENCSSHNPSEDWAANPITLNLIHLIHGIKNRHDNLAFETKPFGNKAIKYLTLMLQIQNIKKMVI